MLMLNVYKSRMVMNSMDIRFSRTGFQSVFKHNLIKHNQTLEISLLERT